MREQTHIQRAVRELKHLDYLNMFAYIDSDSICKDNIDKTSIFEEDINAFSFIFVSYSDFSIYRFSTLD